MNFVCAFACPSFSSKFRGRCASDSVMRARVVGFGLAVASLFFDCLLTASTVEVLWLEREDSARLRFVVKRGVKIEAKTSEAVNIFFARRSVLLIKTLMTTMQLEQNS